MGVITPDSIDIPIIKIPREFVRENNLIPAPGTYIQPSDRRRGDVVFRMEFGEKGRSGTRVRHDASWPVISSCPVSTYGFSVDEIFFRSIWTSLLLKMSMKSNRGPVPGQNRSSSVPSWIRTSGHFTYSFMKIGEYSGDTSPAEKFDKGNRERPRRIRKVLELAIPFESLDCLKEEWLEFFVTIQIPGSFGERWPSLRNLFRELPGADFSVRMWHA